VKLEFLAACREKQQPPVEFYKDYLLSDWKDDVENRITAAKVLKSGAVAGKSCELKLSF
jgi:hypothetical protein